MCLLLLIFAVVKVYRQNTKKTWYNTIGLSPLAGVLYSTKSRNEMTKSLNDNTGFGVVGIVQIFIFYKVGSALDTEWYQAIIYVRCCCFPDLCLVNIQGVKTHTVGNYSARSVLKDVQLEL